MNDFIEYTYVCVLSKNYRFNQRADHVDNPDWHQWVDFYNRLANKNI